jgi:two-component system, cell cycle sensor histidine kinase PleC
LLDVINDILDMSKIEAGRVELELSLIEMGSMLEEVMRFVQPRAVEGGIELKQSIGKSNSFIADRRALKQVLINLISNAIKFTPDGGMVTVKSSLDGEQIKLQIIDTGIGIPQHDIEKLGRPFEQVENQFTKSKGGSGLGLAISKSLIALHGGTLAIASKEGVGTTVTVRIPFKSA